MSLDSWEVVPPGNETALMQVTTPSGLWGCAATSDITFWSPNHCCHLRDSCIASLLRQAQQKVP